MLIAVYAVVVCLYRCVYYTAMSVVAWMVVWWVKGTMSSRGIRALLLKYGI